MTKQTSPGQLKQQQYPAARPTTYFFTKST